MTNRDNEQSTLISARPRMAFASLRNLVSFRALSAAIAACLVIPCCLPCVVAQDDPFGADPFGGSMPNPGAAAAQPLAGTVATEPTNAGGSATASDQDPDPMVRLLRINPPKTPHDVAEAIEWMSRVGRMDEVSRLLDIAQRSQWSQPQLVDFSRTGGAALWSRLSASTSGISDAHREYVRQVAQLPSKLARDPNWIDGWISRLSAPAAADRREAEMRLHEASGAAVSRLVGRLMTGDPTDSASRMVDAVLQFDADGVEALQAAVTSPVENVAGRVLLALAMSNTSDFSSELGAGMESLLLPESVRMELQKTLRARHANLPEPAKIHEYLLAKFKRQLEAYQLARQQRSRAPAKAWRLSNDGMGVSQVEVSAADKALERLAQIAHARAQLSVSTHEDLVACATVLLQHRYQAAGDRLVNPQTDLAWLLSDEELTVDFWKQVFDQSRIWQMHGSSMLAAQALGSALADSQPGEPAFDFVASLLRDPRPVIRYSATAAIAASGVESEYNGAATAMENAIEMSRLGQGPMVLVVGLTGELRQAAEQQVAALGGTSVAVLSTAEALKVLDKPYPIENVLVVDRVMGSSVSALVGRIRNARRASSLPIAVLTDDLAPFEVSELNRTPGVVLSVLTQDAANLARVFAEMDRQLDTRPLSSAERIQFAEAASRLIIALSGDRSKFGFYPLARWESELINDRIGLPSSARMAVLAGIGSSASQIQLVSMAADSAMDENRRLGAAEAFGQSVRQFGVRLSRSETMKAYDLYNELGPNDAVAAKALGKVLDFIESASKPDVQATP